MSDFLTPLQLEFIDGHFWKLTCPLEYRLGAPDGQEVVTVPKDFITDFASIPQILWNVLPPTGLYGKSAVVHDWLYQKRIIHTGTPESMRLCSRGEADGILNEAMGVLGVGRVTRWVIYSGVRVGGWKAWGDYRRMEEQTAKAQAEARGDLCD